MIRQKFREEKSSLGRILRPVAEVILEKDGFCVKIPLYIDSGADVSMIPFRFGKALYPQKCCVGAKWREIRRKDCVGVGGRGSYFNRKNGYIQQISSYI